MSAGIYSSHDINPTLTLPLYPLGINPLRRGAIFLAEAMMFGFGGSRIIILLLYIFFVYIMPVILLAIASYIVYKKMKGASAEEIEEARRINKEQ